MPCTRHLCKSGVAHTQPARANSGSTLLPGWHSTCNPTQVLGHAAHMRTAMRRAMRRMIRCSVPGKERPTSRVEGRQVAFCLVQIYHDIKRCVPDSSLSKCVVLNHGRQHNCACAHLRSAIVVVVVACLRPCGVGAGVGCSTVLTINGSFMFNSTEHA